MQRVVLQLKPLATGCGIFEVWGGSGPRGEIERRLAAHAAAGGEILLGADTAAGPGIDQHDIERLQLVTDELCSR